MPTGLVTVFAVCGAPDPPFLMAVRPAFVIKSHSRVGMRCGIVLFKKTPVSHRNQRYVGSKKNADDHRQRTLLPMPSRRERPLYNTDPPSCNSPVLAPQGFRLSYLTYLLRSFLPMAVLPNSVTLLRSFPCAHSAIRGGFQTLSSF